MTTQKVRYVRRVKKMPTKKTFVTCETCAEREECCIWYEDVGCPYNVHDDEEDE